jgi:hypothetical protein
MTAICTALAAAVTVLAPSMAAGAGTSISGAITITGSQSRDNLAISIGGEGSQSAPFVVEPAATITGTTGSCPADVDPLTGRPVRNDCRIPMNSNSTLTVDLRGGDDAVSIKVENTAPISAITAIGNVGNDQLLVEGVSPRTLRGGDGDDVLDASGATGSSPVAFDGGAGRDLAVFGDVRTQIFNGTDDGRSRVSASLVTNQASVMTRNSAGTLVVVRTDSLAGIERLQGTPLGDILTGGTGPDELIGGDGPDDLRGGDGTDLLSGGDGIDDLQGGKDADTLDGGVQADTYPRGAGNDTFLTRDGHAETVTCVQGDVVVNDLVDRADNPAGCTSISTAAAKHRFDTVLPGKPLRVGDDRTLRIPVRCPAPKPDRCEGALAARVDKRAGGRAKRAPKGLGRGDYALRPGRRAVLEFSLSPSEARRVRGKAVSLEADEVDGDGRARKVVRRVRVKQPR